MLLMSGLVFGATARAADWPQFRGPTGQGLAEGRLPVEWGPTTNVAWKQPIPGLGWSSPVIVGDRVYLTTAVTVAGSSSGDLSLRTLALETASGKTAWETEVFVQDGAASPRIHGKNSHASPTPVVDGKQLFVHFGHQGTACLDLEGKVLWRNRDLKYNPVHGNGGSPVVVDGVVIFSCDGGDRQFVAALDRDSGKVVWQKDRNLKAPKGFSFSTPLVITVKGRNQVVSPASSGVVSYDPKTGQEIWRVTYGDGYSVVPRPVFGHGFVFVCTGFNTPSLLAIRPDGTGDVTATHVAWTLRRNVSHNPSPLLVGNELYVISDNGFATCVDARTGEVAWQQRLGGNFSASPLSADGRIYAQSEQGVGTVFEAGRQFRQLGHNDLKERSLASCAAAGGCLYIRAEKHLYRVKSP
jgi:outer membrane protein assembly factor BamB